MRIIASDTSALIDLRKGALLEAFLKLPFEFIIPDLLLISELIKFTRAERNLIDKKMTVAHLNGNEVIHAQRLVVESPVLSLSDGFALIVAKKYPRCTLLTGDRRLRQRAEMIEVECRGVLWVVEELARQKIIEEKFIVVALKSWREDPLVRLPSQEINRILRSLGAQ